MYWVEIRRQKYLYKKNYLKYNSVNDVKKDRDLLSLDPLARAKGYSTTQVLKVGTR